MKKRTIRWDRLVPPGMNGRREAGQLAAGLAAGLVWNAAAFLVPFLQEYERLTWVRAAFEPFDRHLRRALIPFALLAGWMVALALVHFVGVGLAFRQQTAPDEAGDNRKYDDTGFHGRHRNVTFGKSAVGAQPVGLVGTFQKIPQVVDQIGGTLHSDSENQAQQGGKPMESAIGKGQRRSDTDKDDGITQRIGSHGQHPCGQ